MIPRDSGWLLEVAARSTRRDRSPAGECSADAVTPSCWRRTS